MGKTESGQSTNARRYEQAYELFTRLRAEPPQARSWVLDQACNNDPELRREVEDLLAADASPLHLESVPRIDLPEQPDGITRTRLDPAAAAPLPAHIGHYSIRRIIATGGMGVVYEAVQENPHRTVAMKVLRRGIASRSALRRFEHEAQILARLRHPNIAQIFEAGMHQEGTEGVPYFAMEYIPNARTLLQYAGDKQLDSRQRLELFTRVCDAVHHGHQRGVIHRDLKPGNILVEPEGQPKIIDFGVARATDADMLASTLQSDVGQLIGTLQYMSPEQCQADPHDLDSRSDVYALGVVLYELLCGQLPYDVGRAPVPEAIRMVREDTPTRPSTLNRRLRGDLETIVLKTLDKDRDRRYRSAAELADDLRRYLRDEPIMARPPSTFYQFRKFARRNKTLVGSMAAVLVVLMAAAAVSTSYAIRENRARAAANEAWLAEKMQRQEVEKQRSEATRQAAIAGAVNDFLNKDLLAAPRPDRQGREVTMLEVLDTASQGLHSRFDDEPLVGAAVCATLGESYLALGHYGQAEPHLLAALATRRAEFGEEHEATLEAMLLLGWLYQNWNRLDEAEPLNRRATELARSVLGEEHPTTLKAVSMMGVLHGRQGRLPEAEALLVEALDLARRIHGPSHDMTLSSINNLALLYSIQRRHAEAEPLYLEALQATIDLYGERHPHTLFAMSNLGLLYAKQGRVIDAERHNLRVLELRREVLGPDHPDTLTSANNLIQLYLDQNRYQEAEPLLTRLLKQRSRVLGENNEDTLQTMINLAWLYAQQQRYVEAEPLFKRGLELCRRSLGGEHPLTLQYLNNLGMTYSRQGRLDDAEPLFAEALELSYRVYGAGNPRNLEAMSDLIGLYVRQRRCQDAEPLCQRAVDLAQRVLPPGDRLLATLLNDWGKCLGHLKRFETAELYLLAAYEGLASTAGPNDPETLIIAENLSNFYDDWDQPDKAAQWRAQLPSAGQLAPQQPVAEEMAPQPEGSQPPGTTSGPG